LFGETDPQNLQRAAGVIPALGWRCGARRIAGNRAGASPAARYSLLKHTTNPPFRQGLSGFGRRKVAPVYHGPGFNLRIGADRTACLGRKLPLNPLRVAIVTRRFWPLIGSTERMSANLAAGLAGRGWQVTVVTPRWQPGWPERITLREVPVVRLPAAPRGRWAAWRYVRGLRQWLTDHAQEFDLVYVTTLKHEAAAAVGALRGRVPVVLRPAAAGLRGDCLWQIDTAEGRRIKRLCVKADGFIASCPAAERELQAAGYRRDRIECIPLGVTVGPLPSPTVKAALRATLAEVNRALEMPRGAPLAVCVARRYMRDELQRLVAAWHPIARRWPNVRLWLIGEHGEREPLIRHIEASNLAGRVVPAGVFDEVDSLLAAADLFVAPTPHADRPLAVLEAMAAGLPIVAVDSPGTRPLIADAEHGLLVPPEEVAPLSAAIHRMLDEPKLAARLGAAARNRADAEFTLAEMVDRHVTCFQSLLHQNQPSHQDRPRP